MPRVPSPELVRDSGTARTALSAKLTAPVLEIVGILITLEDDPSYSNPRTNGQEEPSMKSSPFSTSIKPNWKALVRCIERKGTPDRVHFIELFLDREVQAAICNQYDLLDGLDPDDPFHSQKAQIRLQRFLGYDYVRCGLEELEMPLWRAQIDDTAPHNSAWPAADTALERATVWQTIFL